MYIDFAQPICLPPYWLNHPEVVQRLNTESGLNCYPDVIAQNLESTDKRSNYPAERDFLGVPHACPLKIKWAEEDNVTGWWQFPIEPVVTISMRNTLVKRNVLKSHSDRLERRGTVKELWSLDDYEITIAGVLIGENGNMPEDDLRKLRGYCEGRKTLDVQNALFTIFKIDHIAIESFELPFTKGKENQMFSIKAVSDDDFDLLIKE